MDLGSFSYTSHVGFTFLWGVSLTHPLLTSFLSREFLLHIPCWLFFWRGVTLTHSILGSFLSRVFLLHIRCWLHFYLESFSYTSRAGFVFFCFFVLFSSREFLLHIPCWIYFSVGSFSYTCITDFVFMWGVSLTHPVLV